MGCEPVGLQAVSTGSREEVRVCRGNRACDQFMGGKSQNYFGGCIWPRGFPLLQFLCNSVCIYLHLTTDLFKIINQTMRQKVASSF